MRVGEGLGGGPVDTWDLWHQKKSREPLGALQVSAVLHGGAGHTGSVPGPPSPCAPQGSVWIVPLDPGILWLFGNPTKCCLAPHSYKDYLHSSFFHISMALLCLSLPAEREFLIPQKKFRSSYGDSFNFPTPNLHGPTLELALSCAFLDM